MIHPTIKRGLIYTALLLSILVGSHRVIADSLVADLSENSIAISSNFSGKSLVLFGAINRSTALSTNSLEDQASRDIIVVISGPTTQNPVTVRHKERMGGIWVNTNAIDFTGVPDYYFVAANRDFDDIADREVFRRNQVLAENLKIQPIEKELDEETLNVYRDAIIRNKIRDKLFYEIEGGVTFLDDTLFRANVEIPAHIAVGIYNTKVFLISDGHVISVQSKSLDINKTGFERTIYEFAYDSPFFYGLLAVIFALVAGWIASLVFRQE